MQLTIVLKADGSGLTGTVRVAEADARRLGAAFDQTGQQARRAEGEVNRLASAKDRAAGSTRRLIGEVGSLRGLLSGLGIAVVSRQIIEAGLATERWTSAFTAITGSGAGAAREIAFLRGEAERLGVYLPTLVDGYMSLAAATRDTALEGQQTREIFIAIAEAGRVLKLRTDQVQGALYAVQQMVSKGAVTMEELRRQLGDRIPGAFGLAARAMGMSTAELTKLVETGTLTADVLLPRLAAELRSVYAAGVALAAASPQAVFERMRTALFDLFAVMANSGVMDALTAGARTLTATLNEFATGSVGKAVGATLGNLLSLFDQLLVAVALFYGARGLAALGPALMAAANWAAGFSATLTQAGLAANTAAVGMVRFRTAVQALAVSLGGIPMLLAAIGAALYSLSADYAEWEAAQNRTITTLSQMTESMRKAREEAERMAREDLTKAQLASVKAIEEAEAAIVSFTRQLDAARAEQEKFADSLIVDPDSYIRLAEEIDRLTGLIEGNEDAIRKHTDELVDSATIMDGAATSAKDFADALKKVEEGLDRQANALRAQVIEQQQGLRAALTWQAVQEAGVETAEQLSDTVRLQIDEIVRMTGVLEAGAQAERDAAEAKREHEQAVRALVRSLESEEKAHTKALQAQEEARLEAEGYKAVLLDELATIGLSEEALRRHSEMQALDNLIKEAGGEITAEQAATLRDQVNATLDLIFARERQVEAEREFVEQSRQQAEDYRRAWRGAVDSVAAAFGDFVADGMKDFKSFADSIKSIAKRLLADLVAMFARNALFKWLSGGGGGGWGAALGAALGLASGGGGGGGGGGGTANVVQMGSQLYGSFAQAGTSGGGLNLQSLGSTMFSGFGNAANTFFQSGAGSQFAAAAPWAAAAGGALYGYRNAGSGGASSLAAAAAYGGLGYVGGTIALGGLMGGAAGAATGVAGAAMGGAATGAMGAAAAIPIVGWILAIAAIVDIIAGGRLFGTRFRPESATSSIGVGAEGAFAEAEVREVRQRSLFRGRTWRTRSIDPGDEALDAAQALYESVEQVMADSARQLRGTAPDMIEAAIRTVQEFDSKGKVKATQLFVDILGRSWEAVDAEDAARRISAEAIIATIDHVLGYAVEQVTLPDLGNGEGPGGDSGDIGNGPIGETIIKTLQLMGEASAIAERWRDDSEVLMDGAQFLLIAARDIVNGIGLLGEGPGSLMAVADLVEELAYGGETLTQTYVRLQQATTLLTQATDMMGVDLGLAREEFVRFAVDIAEAAGGIDRAAALWNDYFQRFFSAEERAQYALTQARTTAGQEFGDVGLDFADFEGEGAGEAFRELFEAYMASAEATPEGIVQWLEAANALGVFIDASAALAQATGTAADTVFRNAEGIAAVLDQLGQDDYLAGLSDYERELAEIGLAFDAYRADLVAMGATVEELAELEGLRASALERATAAAQAQIEDILNQNARDALLAGLSELDAELAEVGFAFDDYRLQLLALGATTAQLAQLDDQRAAAIARVIAAEAERQAAEEARRAAVVGDILIGNELSLLSEGMTEYQRQAVQTIRSYEDQRQQLLENGATAQQLTALEMQRGRAMAQLAAQLEGTIRQQIEALGYDALSQVEQQIAALESEADTTAEALGGVAGGIRQIRDAAQEFRDSILIDSQLSGLSVQDQFGEAMRQLRETGDSGTARRALELARELMATGVDYRTARDEILGLVRNPAEAGAVGAPGGPAGRAVSAELAALYAERERLQAEAQAAQRFGDATLLLRNLADLSRISGDALPDLAARLGLTDLGLLATDLGLPDLAALQSLADSYTSFDPLTMISAGDQAIIAAILGNTVQVGGGLQPLPIQSENGTDFTLPAPIGPIAPGPIGLRVDDGGKSAQQAEQQTAALDAIVQLLGQLVDATAKAGAIGAGQRDAMVRSLQAIERTASDPVAKPLRTPMGA